MRLGTWLAVTYAVPRQPAPTVWAKTSVRASPSTREMTVRPAMSAAPRAMPAAGLRVGSAAAPVTGHTLRAAGTGRRP